MKQPLLDKEQNLQIFFSDYLASIENSFQREKMADLFRWIHERFPRLSPIIAWNQPMFTDHGTYILGFSAAKAHFSVAPEKETMTKFSDEVRGAGYSQTALLFRIKWDQAIDYPLLEKIIRFNIEDKQKCQIFWR